MHPISVNAVLIVLQKSIGCGGITVVCSLCFLCGIFSSSVDEIQSAAEVVLVDESFRPQRVYHLEDFFWTGSGEGALDDGDTTSWDGSGSAAPTIFFTTTVTSIMTVTPSSTSNAGHETASPAESSSSGRCVHDCEGPSTPAGDIQPTRSGGGDASDAPTHTPASAPRYQTPGRRYWLLTVLQTKPETEPTLAELETRLATLYQIAFYRQQERHLGIQHREQNRTKRSTPPPTSAEILKAKPNVVNVQIHNITRNMEPDEVELLYSVRVSGQPVPATTAAKDMRLVSDAEVVQELGYSFRTKAEPYLKEEAVPLGLAKSESTWIFVASALAILLLLLLLLTVVVVGIRKKSQPKLIESPREPTQAPETVLHERQGQTNLGFKTEDAQVQTCGGVPSFITPMQMAKPFVRKLQSAARATSDSGSTSSTSSSSSEPSPTSSFTRFHWSEHQNARQRYKVVPQDQTNNQQQHNEDDYAYKEVVDATNIVAIRKANDARSAHSYLSMPSVKNFPRGSIPEPLSRVLEPVSVRHLDEGPMTPFASPEKPPGKPPLARHGSMQEAEDPGVIGPLVWNQHCQRLQHAVSKENVAEAPNVGRMKKRFQELLDDAFSLFGSRSVSPEDVASISSPPLKKIDSRAHSAFPRLSSDTDSPQIPAIQPRPKTSDPRRSTTPGVEAPRRAWGSGAPSPLVRPLSAGPFHRPTLAPHICPGHILPEGRLAPSDPAVPVIDAIKDELRRCTQPSRLGQ